MCWSFERWGELDEVRAAWPRVDGPATEREDAAEVRRLLNGLRPAADRTGTTAAPAPVGTPAAD